MEGPQLRITVAQRGGPCMDGWEGAGLGLTLAPPMHMSRGQITWAYHGGACAVGRRACAHRRRRGDRRPRSNRAGPGPSLGPPRAGPEPGKIEHPCDRERRKCAPPQRPRRPAHFASRGGGGGGAWPPRGLSRSRECVSRPCLPRGHSSVTGAAKGRAHAGGRAS
jgi:hypothetical protein